MPCLQDSELLSQSQISSSNSRREHKLQAIRPMNNLSIRSIHGLYQRRCRLTSVQIQFWRATACHDLRRGYVKQSKSPARRAPFGRRLDWSTSEVRPAYRTERVPAPMCSLWFAVGVHSDSIGGWRRRFLPDGSFPPLQMNASLARREAGQYKAAVRCGAALSHAVRMQFLRSKAARSGQ